MWCALNKTTKYAKKKKMLGNSIFYLSQRRRAKAQASLCTRAVSPEPYCSHTQNKDKIRCLQNLGITPLYIVTNFLARYDFCHLLKAFASSLEPDQDRQYVGPDLDSNCLTLL